MKKNTIKFLLVFAILLTGFSKVSYAENPTVSLTIRSGENIIYQNTVPLPDAGSKEINDDAGSPHNIDTKSVLSIIDIADAEDDTWNLSNLQYFDSFGALYLKCIESSSGEDCDNWQYIVNNSSPFSSIDQTTLNGGEKVYIYFGQSSKVILSSDSIKTTDNLTVTAQKYDYENNTWLTREGVTVGLTQPNPSDPFNPTEAYTSPVDSNGQAVFSNILKGDYNVGIKEDYYFPTLPLVVNEIAPVSSGGTSSGNNSRNTTTTTTPEKITPIFNLQKAFDFLISKQEEGGNFGKDIYTDWIGISLAGGNNQQVILKLIKYLNEQKTDDYSLTDYERRAMTLMTLGLNPYNTNGTNYVEKIISSFDGIQIGNKTEDNDDIFGIIVLQNTGFTYEDSILKNSIEFILTRQKENGSWDESIDMTGAGIEALSNFKNDERVKNAIEKAKLFLKNNQKDDGGFGNVSSTAWAIEGIRASGDKISDWKKNNLTPIDYLGEKQDLDGGMKNDNIENKIWETAYAAKANLEKTWNQLMYTFQKQNKPGVVLGETTSKKVIDKNFKKPINTKKSTSNTPVETNTVITPESTDITNQKPAPIEGNWFLKILNSIWNSI